MDMSVRERRNRKDSRSKTPEQLHHNRCAVCMGPIRRDEPKRPAARGSGWAHTVCIVLTEELPALYADP